MAAFWCGSGIWLEEHPPYASLTPKSPSLEDGKMNIITVHAVSLEKHEHVAACEHDSS